MTLAGPSRKSLANANVSNIKSRAQPPCNTGRPQHSWNGQASVKQGVVAWSCKTSNQQYRYISPICYPVQLALSHTTPPITLAVLFASFITVFESNKVISPESQAKLSLYTSNNSLYQYSTQFRQGIISKAFLSHNDLWRSLPLYSAIAAGAISVRADVWLCYGTLHVGHEQAALTRDRTSSSLYI
jgi:hypothetical protein